MIKYRINMCAYIYIHIDKQVRAVCPLPNLDFQQWSPAPTLVTQETHHWDAGSMLQASSKPATNSRVGLDEVVSPWNIHRRVVQK